MSLWHFIYYKADPTEVNVLIAIIFVSFVIGVLAGVIWKEKKNE